MRFDAIKITQNGHNFLLTALSAEQLRERTDVDVWEPSNPEGYQRQATERRAKEFSRYIAQGGISPTAILLNVRDADSLTEVEPGIFDLRDDAKLWLVDGQHRELGLSLIAEERPEYSSMAMPVIIMTMTDRYREAEQYLIINRTQKGVRADLAERILAEKARKEGALEVESGQASSPLPSSLARDIGWRSKAVELTDLLNQRVSSPLRGRIKLPNVPGEGATVSQKSMCDSLQAVLRNDVCRPLSRDDLATVLINFWKAVEALCPEPFDEVRDTGKAQEYLLLRTAGPFVLHRVLVRLIPYCQSSDGRWRFTEEIFGDLLAKASTRMSARFWQAQGDGTIGALGSSQKSFALAADLIMDEIEAALPETEYQISVEL